MSPAGWALEFAKQAVVQLLKAILSSWLGSFLLVSAISCVCVRFTDMSYPFEYGWLRFLRLLRICLPYFPFLVLLVLYMHGWAKDPVAAIRWSIRTSAIVFGIVPVIFGLLAVKALFDWSDDPWHYLPGGPPMSLVEFARKYPQLRATDWGWGYALYDREGNRVTFGLGELREATLNWEKCVDQPNLVGMGGPPPFPRSKCILRIVIVQPDYDALTEKKSDRGVKPPNRRIVKYVYRMPWPEPESGEVDRHFRPWAESKGGLGPLMDIESGGKKWMIGTIILGRREQVLQVQIGYTEPTGPPRP